MDLPADLQKLLDEASGRTGIRVRCELFMTGGEITRIQFYRLREDGIEIAYGGTSSQGPLNLESIIREKINQMEQEAGVQPGGSSGIASGCVAEGRYDLTGVWKGMLGGRKTIYHIRQIKDQIFWYCESPSEDDYANVAHGFVAGERVCLQWADVPPRNRRNCGYLILGIAENGTKLTALDKSPSYGDEVWIFEENPWVVRQVGSD